MVLFVLAAALCSIRQTPPNVQISWEPRTVVQGTLLTITVRANDQWTSLGGRFAGEELHFQRIGNAFRAAAAVPVDAPNAESGTLEPTGETDQIIAFAVPVKKGTYKTQALSVATRYGREPDAATRARIDREAAMARKVSENAHSTPRMWQIPFIKPAEGRLTARFGTARVFNRQVKSRHTGLDFAGGIGAPVKAANDGVVALIGHFYLGGNCIYVDHGAGMVTAYLHLSRWSVKAGDRVKKGQVIGRIGATGRVTGPHLHFIARYGKISVDPLSLFRLTGI